MMLTAALNQCAYLTYLLSWPLRRYGPGWNRRTFISLVIWWIGLVGLYRLSQVATAANLDSPVAHSTHEVGAADPPTADVKAPTASATARATDTGAAVLPPGRVAVGTSPVKLANDYAWGNCTAYVASRRPIPPRWGHARSWLSSAQRAGWATGSSPRPGAVAWTSAGRLGHVALVEAIEGDKVLVSEMNFIGLGRKSQRWVSSSSFRYIY